MSDHELKTLVEAVIASRPILAKANVGTEVFDGRVFLIGSVETLAEEREALLAAKSVPGVREVISSLRVAEIEPRKADKLDDATLKSRVEAALLDHGNVLVGEGVVVSNGEIYLRGRVESVRQKTKAGRLATIVDGVQTVHNELEIVAEKTK